MHVEQRRHARVDSIEEKLVILFSLQLPFVCKLAFHLMTLRSFFLYGGCAVLTFEALFMLKLLRHVRTLQGLSGCCRRPHTALSPERLHARLRYIVGTYADHAPFWKFVLWARTLALAAISEAAGDYVLVQAVATIAVLFLALLLHMRTQPYALRFQNQLETALGASSVLVVALGCGYRKVLDPGGERFPTSVDTGLFVLLLSPLALPFMWMVSGRRHRAASQLRDVLLGDASSKAQAVSSEAYPL